MDRVGMAIGFTFGLALGMYLWTWVQRWARGRITVPVTSGSATPPATPSTPSPSSYSRPGLFGSELSTSPPLQSTSTPIVPPTSIAAALQTNQEWTEWREHYVVLPSQKVGVTFTTALQLLRRGYQPVQRDSGMVIWQRTEPTPSPTPFPLAYPETPVVVSNLSRSA